MEAVTLRQVAARAGVQLGLIDRHVGNRDALIEAVYVDLSTKLAAEVTVWPLAQLSFERQSTMGRWTIMLTHFVTTRAPPTSPFDPVNALASVFESEFGLDRRSARLRVAQASAAALGWRLFEDYLVASADLTSVPVSELRDELTETNRHVGATPWTSPPRALGGARRRPAHG